MTKRRLIRTLFLLPILLCLAGWAWSGSYYALAHFATDHSDANHEIVYYANFASIRGEIACGIGRNGGSQNYWSCSVQRLPAFSLWPSQRSGVYPGFYFGPPPTSPDSGFYTFSISYLFLLLLSSALFLLIYRKTRPKPDPRTAFPVEIEKPHD